MRRDGASSACDAVLDAAAGASSAGIDRGLPLPGTRRTWTVLSTGHARLSKDCSGPAKPGFGGQAAAAISGSVRRLFFGQAAVQRRLAC